MPCLSAYKEASTPYLCATGEPLTSCYHSDLNLTLSNLTRQFERCIALVTYIASMKLSSAEARRAKNEIRILRMSRTQHVVTITID